MKKLLFAAFFLMFIAQVFASPARAGLNDLSSQLEGAAINAASTCESPGSGNCSSGSSAMAAIAQSCSSGALGSGGGFLSGIMDFFKQLFGGIIDFFRNIFGGGGGVDNGGGSAPPISFPPVSDPPVSNPPIDSNPPVDGGTTTSTPPVDGGTTTTPPTDDGTTTTTTDTTVSTPPATPTGGLPIKSDVRTGGKSMENGAYNWARGAVQPRTNDGTVLRHEAVHYINGELTRKLGSNGSWTNLNPNVKRGFYLWGEDRFWVIPNTSLRKGEVEALVPTHLTTSHRNYFHNFDFGSRDALHIMEDFSAEISSGEKSHLLFDMMLNAAAMGLKLEQLDAQGTNKYWSSEGGAILRGTIKTFFEKAGMTNSSYMQTFRNDTNPKSIAIKDFLKRIYGAAWVKQVIGI